MGTEVYVRDALFLLEQMTEEPEEILNALDAVARKEVIKELGDLAEQAANVQNESNFLALLNAVYDVVEERVELRTLLLPEGMDIEAARRKRTITIADYRATSELNAYIQERAPQIRNAILECRAQLEAILHTGGDIQAESNQKESHRHAKQ